ncbi:hypothetical protein N7454_009264 [Penicillium verhagenii]|nr:hypothetical protein N7454_009264 [Penicillium verhagenii]
MGSELGVTAQSKDAATLTPVAIWWVVWGCVWTLFVSLGVAYLIKHRESPTVRIRGLGLTLSAVFFLHIYFWAVQSGVMIGNLMPGDAMYWMMGTWLPIGVSLFYASNGRFIHIAKLQKKYAYPCNRLSVKASPRHKESLLARFQRLDYSTRSFIVVGISMFVQILLTILMWVISRRFHSTWGISGTEVHGTAMEQKSAQGKGWEWWPGVASQFFWSWVVAPYVLWKARDINDTQGWRTQTIACAIAGLPGTPLWLCGIYVDAFAPMAAVWIPPQWICLSIIVIEIFTIFLPCWEVMHRQSLRQETLEAIAQWEARNKTGGETKSMGSGPTIVASILSGFRSTKGSIQSNASNESILTMGALEYVLDRNPGPLQEFSALREFSGENIAFLTAVAEWKSSLPVALQDKTAPRDDKIQELMRDPFNRALHLYAEFISPSHAEFPVNLSHQVLRKPEQIFEKPTALLYGEREHPEPATPFRETFNLDSPVTPLSGDSEKGLNSSSKTSCNTGGDIPADFDATVFDEAESSIKYLVLTNTWPKFIRSHRASIASGSSTTLDGGDIVVSLGDERST